MSYTAEQIAELIALGEAEQRRRESVRRAHAGKPLSAEVRAKISDGVRRAHQRRTAS